MPPMRTVALGAQPGERELAAFGAEVHRPVVIVGNGPSAALPPHSRIPANPVVFRMNWFFLESHYHFGSHVDGWFFAVPNQLLEESLGREVRARRYTLDRVLSPMEIPSLRDGDGWGNALLDLPIEQYDHWAVISRYPRLARFFMSRPGLPTTGMQALGFALGAGFREVYLCGIDLYEATEARYGYTVPEHVAAGLLLKDVTPGYESAHSIDADLAFLRACLAEFPDARVHNLSESVNLGMFLAPPPHLGDRASLRLEPAPQLGQPKDRVVCTLPEAGTSRPVVVRAPTDNRLWKEIEGRRCAYVTMVSGDYHHGTRALANSLRRVTDVPLLALCTADADRVALAASDIHVIDVPDIVNPNRADKFQKRFAPTYTKLNVFRLDFLDRLVYLDSDTVVRKSLDELFAGRGFAAAPDAGFERTGAGEFNSGVFAADPSYDLFSAMMNRLTSTPSRDGGDQGFLNAVFPQWQQLPQEYNTTKRIFSHHPALYLGQDVKVLHYVGSKPWDPAPLENRYAELDREWLEFLEGWELRELVGKLRADAAAALAEASANELAGGKPLAGTPFRQAQQLNAARRFVQAEQVLRDAWRTKDATPGELRELARSLRHQSRYPEAVRQLRAAARLNPGSRPIRRELLLARARVLAHRWRRLQALVRHG